MNNIKVKGLYKQYSGIITICLWIIFIIWKIPFLNKGIDYTDTGFNMENYKNVFFGEGITDIGLVLTNLIGGIIYKLLPAYQLLVYRILHWIIGILTAFFAYQIFKRYLDKNLILVLLIGLSLATKGGESIYSYYPMTSLVLILALMFLHTGLVDKKNSKLVTAGIISGINILFRLTNLIYLAMVLLIIFYGWINGYSKKETIKTAFLYVAGAAGAFICIIPLLFFILGPENLINSFMSYVREFLGIVDKNVVNHLAIEEKSGHSLSAEIKTLGQQGISSITVMICCFVPVVILWELIRTFIKRVVDFKNNFLMEIVFAVYSIVVLFVLKNKISGTVFLILAIGSLCFSFAFLLKSKKIKSEYALLFASTFLMGCCSVIGSDLGFRRISIIQSYAVLSIALGVQLIMTCTSLNNKYFKIAKNFVKSFSIFFITLCIGNLVPCQLN